MNIRRQTSVIPTRIFVLGCIILVAVLVAFFWAFSRDELTPSQYFLLKFIFPIGSAIAAWCFAGGMNAKGQFRGVGVAATGGFAVWIITMLSLHPPEPVPDTDWVERTRGEIVGIRGSWEVMIREAGNNEAIRSVYNRAPEAGRKMFAHGEDGSLGKQIDQYEWASYAYYMAADAAFRLTNTVKYAEYVGQAERFIEIAASKIRLADSELLAKPRDEYLHRLQDEIHTCYDRDRIDYLRVMILSLRNVAEGVKNSQQIAALWRKLDKIRLAELEVDPRFTPYVKDVVPL